MTPIVLEIIYLSADQATSTGSNFVYHDPWDFRPYQGPVDQDNIKKGKPYHKFTKRRLDGRFQK